MTSSLRLLSIALLLAACGETEPRFASVSVSSSAPTATLSGHTSPTAVSAVELSPGCPGFVDPALPEHVVRLEDATAIVVSARSLHGPVALAVVGGGEVRCDADGGSGHAPHVTLSAPGEYAVYVGALASPMDFAYELEIAPATTGATTSASASTRIGVTVTSEPAGASVRTPEGEALGTTPAMFVLPVSADEMGRERRFVVEMPGYAPAEVSGRLVGASMVLHASLTPDATPVVPDAGPAVGPAIPAVAGAVGSLLDTTVSVERPIRDYRTTTAAFEIAGACTVSSVAIGVDVEHSYVGDLRITVLTPSAGEIVLRDHTGAGNEHLVSSYDASTVAELARLLGQSATGRWDVRMRDDAGADTGTFHAASLRVGCTETTGATAHAGSTSRPGSGSSSGGSGTYGRRPRDPRVIDPWGTPPPGATITGPIPTPTPPVRAPRSNGPATPPPTSSSPF